VHWNNFSTYGMGCTQAHRAPLNSVCSIARHSHSLTATRCRVGQCSQACMSCCMCQARSAACSSTRHCLEGPLPGVEWRNLRRRCKTAKDHVTCMLAAESILWHAAGSFAAD
jgi:hypothetical protein